MNRMIWTTKLLSSINSSTLFKFAEIQEILGTTNTSYMITKCYMLAEKCNSTYLNWAQLKCVLLPVSLHMVPLKMSSLATNQRMFCCFDLLNAGTITSGSSVFWGASAERPALAMPAVLAQHRAELLSPAGLVGPSPGLGMVQLDHGFPCKNTFSMIYQNI